VFFNCSCIQEVMVGCCKLENVIIMSLLFNYFERSRISEEIYLTDDIPVSENYLMKSTQTGMSEKRNGLNFFLNYLVSKSWKMFQCLLTCFIRTDRQTDELRELNAQGGDSEWKQKRVRMLYLFQLISDHMRGCIHVCLYTVHKHIQKRQTHLLVREDIT
jgi:hypothetical protein